MYKKIVVGVLSAVIFVVAAGLMSDTSMEIQNRISAFRDLKRNILLWNAIHTLFGIVLGLPLIAGMFFKNGKWSFNIGYLFIPVLLLGFGIYPLLGEKLIILDYLGFAGISLFFSTYAFIAFGYSLTLLVSREGEIT